MQMACYEPRGVLAKAIFKKFHNDTFLENLDLSYWYNINYSNAFYSDKFLPLRPDEATLKWIEKAKKETSSNIWIQIWHCFAKRILQFFMTQTDINGLLKRGSMFILSEQQFGNLLNSGGFHTKIENKGLTILDIGAGDGEITIQLVNSVSSSDTMNNNVRVYATETSWAMRKRLENRKFEVISRIEDLSNVHLISCLNVLDRCFDPFELLRKIHKSLSPSGRCIIALVLPYTHYVEFNASHLPLRPLLAHWPHKARQLSFEDEARIFFEVLEKLGFRIESWTKAPYLCEGDLHQSFYWLIDLVVVVSKIN